MVRFALIPLLLAAAAADVSAQPVSQGFEQGLGFDQCFAGNNVTLGSGAPIEGQWQLVTGPLSQNKSAVYFTPYFSLTAGDMVRFSHRNESKGGKSAGAPAVVVDLLGTDRAVAATLYTYAHTASTQIVTTALPVPIAGIFRLRFTFAAKSGSERVALDDIVVDGDLASTDPPVCGPQVPGVIPPQTSPDSALSLNSSEVLVSVLDNDQPATNPIDPATVDLQPENHTEINRLRDIYSADGSLIGRATVGDDGKVLVAPVSGYVGSLSFPYTVRDITGIISGSALVVVSSQSAVLDLQVEATGPSTANVGDAVRYTSRLTNLGPADLETGTFTFTASDALGSLSATCPGTRRSSCGVPQVAGRTITIPIVALPAGTSVSLQLDGVILAGFSAAMVTGSVAPAAPAIDQVPSNNSAAVTTIIQARALGADLAVTLEGTEIVVPGHVTTYVATIRNYGPAAADNAQLTMAAPAGFSFEANTGACSTAFPCSLGTIAPGASATVTTRYRTAVPPGVIRPVPPASVVATAQSTTTDPDPADNTATAQTLFNTSVDVEITVTPSGIEVPAGGTVDMFVLARNDAPNPARSFTVQLQFPAGLVLVSAAADVGSVSPSGVWSIPELAPGLQGELLLRLSPAATGSFIVRARATPPPTDSDASDDESDAEIRALASADLATRITTTTPAPPVGTQAEVTVHAANLGPSGVPGGRVSIVLPSGVSLASAVPGAGSFDPSTLTWSVGPMPSSAQASLTLGLAVDAQGTLPLSARISDAQQTFDRDLTNNAHTFAFNAASSADLSVSIAADIPEPVVGQTVAIHSVVRNGGPSPAPNSVVNYTGPSGSATVLSVSVSAGTTSGYQWQVGELAPGAQATLDAVIRINTSSAIPLTAAVAAAAADPETGNNTATVTLNGAPDLGRVSIDFEDLTGTESCWLWPGMAPGGYAPTGAPFGRAQANPPAQLLVQLVTNPLTSGVNQVYSPWIHLHGAGAIRFRTKVTDTSSAPRLRVFLEDVATRTPLVIFDQVYPEPSSPGGVLETIPIAATGVHRVSWEFSGTGGRSRAAVDDIVIDGTAASNNGAPGQRLAPYECRPILPGNTPPVAVPDFATTPTGVPVIVPFLANDRDPDGSINPQFVDLDPNALGNFSVVEVLRSDGLRIGRAVYSAAAGSMTFEPEPGVAGTAEIAYTVQDNTGSLSNISYVTILVGSVAADLAIAITAPATATGGQAVAYNVRVENRGPDGAVNVVLDHLFSGMAVQSAVCAVESGDAVCAAGTASGSTFHAVIPGMPSSSAVAYTLTATAPTMTSTVSGSATVSATAPAVDPDVSNNTAAASTAVSGTAPPVRADVAVQKTGPADAAIGQPVAYTVTVTNNGPSAAEAVLVSDPTPPGFSLVRITGACTSPACSLGTMPVGQQRLIRYEYVAGPASRTSGGSLPVTNVVSVSAATVDPVPANNQARFVTRVRVATELGISGRVSDAATAVGRTTTIGFSVGNAGPSAASGVTAAIVMPAGLTFVKASPADAFNPATGVWTIGAVAANSVADLEIDVTPNAAGVHVTAAAIATGAGADTDRSNNTTAVDLSAAAVSDIGLSSRADNPSPVAGEIVELTLSAGNAGPATATGLRITGVLPEGLTYLSHSASQGLLDLATAVWSTGDLAAGTTATLTVVVRVDHDGVFSTSAAVTSLNERDLNRANDSTGVILNSGPAADVGIEITAAPVFAALGQTITLRAALTNTGPAAATDVVALIPIPAGLRVISVRASPGTIASGQWIVGSLPVNAAATLEAVAEVTAAGALVVNGSVSRAEADPNPVNDTTFVGINSSDTANVRLSMVAGTPETLISDNGTVYVVVTNEGHAASLPVEVAITQDPALLPLTGTASQGQYAAATGRWSLGSLPAGATATLALVLRVSNGGALPVTAAIVSPALLPSLRRTSTAVVTLNVYEPLRTVADLQVTMAATPLVTPGGHATIEALAFNAGSTYALDLTLRVALPPGAMFVSATPSFRGVCAMPVVGAAGEVRCTWPGQSVVGSGRPRSVSIVAQAAPGLADGTRLTFAGAVSSATYDPLPLNDVASGITIVSASPTTDVGVTKSLTGGGTVLAVAQGQPVSYRVTVSNVGSLAAAGISLIETVPSGFLVTAASVSQGSVDAAAQRWNVGTLAPGAAATLDVALTAAAAGRFELVSVRESATPVDGNPVNDRAMVVIDVVPAGGGGRFVAAGNVDGAGAAEIITGAGVFEAPQFRIFGGDGSEQGAFYAFDPRFAGGVRVAACDIDADGRDEVVVAAGPGGGPHIRIFKMFLPDRVVEVNSWYAFEESYRGGVWVACGDVTGDGEPEVIAGSGTVGAPSVRVWEVRPFSVRELFWMPVLSAARREARVAVCDVNGDGRGEVLAASGPGGPVEAMVLDPATGVVRMTGTVLAGLTTGAFVACGDLTPLVPGPEIAVAADAGGAPLIEFYSAAGARLGALLADVPTASGGLRVAAGNVDGAAPGIEFITGAGVGALPVIRVGSVFTGAMVELRRIVAPNVP